jgi:putative flippase GtrA
LNSLLGLAVIYFLKYFAGWSDFTANLLGYIAGLSLSLQMNSRWTFRYRGSILGVVPRFGGVVAVAYLANWMVVRSLVDWNDYLAHAAGLPVYTAICYLGMKHYVYRAAEGDRHDGGAGIDL